MIARATPVVGVLALQGDVREHEAMLVACGARTVRVREARQLDGLDGLVLPGGESTTMSRLAVQFDLIDPLRQVVAAGLPVYGSCAGMILLADRVERARPDHQGIGGLDITVRRNAFGRQIDSFEADLDPAGFGGEPPLHAVFIRAPWVDEVGDTVTVLARVPHAAGATADTVADTAADTAARGATGQGANNGAGRIVAVAQGRLLATAFHPELTGDLRVHQFFLNLVAQRG